MTPDQSKITDSELSARSLEIVITGYMADRSDLVRYLEKVVPAYDNHMAVRKMVGEEIDRIDKAVSALLRAHSVVTAEPTQQEEGK